MERVLYDKTSDGWTLFISNTYGDAYAETRRENYRHDPNNRQNVTRLLMRGACTLALGAVTRAARLETAFAKGLRSQL